MKLKLSLVSGTDVDDIAVTLDGTATVGALAERLRVSHPRVRSSTTPGDDLCIRVDPGGLSERTISPSVSVAESGLRSGDAVAITNASPGSGRVATAAATVAVISGPDAGKSFSLGIGTAFLGRERDCEIRLTDTLVSKHHARITVTDMVEVVDDNSANGVAVNGELVQRAVVRNGDVLAFGDTECSVTLHAVSAVASPVGSGASVEFNRSPRLDPSYVGIELIAPQPPERPRPQRFPWISIVAPLLMGVVLYA